MKSLISVMEELSIFMHRFRTSNDPEEKDFVFTLLYTLIYLEKYSKADIIAKETITEKEYDEWFKALAKKQNAF